MLNPSKSAIAAVSLLILVCVAQSRPTPPDSIAAATKALREIWQASEFYYFDRGNWPKSLDELFSADYLEMDSAVHQDWTFNMILGPRIFSALSVDTFMIEDCGEWLPSQRGIRYDVLSGHWSGAGVPRYERDTFSADEQAELSKDARNAMRAIWEGAQVFYEDRGEWPATVKQLDAESYIGLSSNISANDPPPELVSPSVFSQWQFALVGIPPERVVAISTSDMPTGVGHWIEYNGIQHSFQGYGTKVRADSIRTPLKHKEYYKK